MRTEKFEFPGYSGEMPAARLDALEQAPRAYALLAHCFTCTKDIYAASRIARALTETGIAVVRFDFTGLGPCGAGDGRRRRMTLSESSAT